MCHRASGLLRGPCTSLERIRSSSDREAWHTLSAGGEPAGTTTQGWGCGQAPHGKGHSPLTTDRAAPPCPGPGVCGASISCPRVGRQPSRTPSFPGARCAGWRPSLNPSPPRLQSLWCLRQCPTRAPGPRPAGTTSLHTSACRACPQSVYSGCHTRDPPGGLQG